jgi:hypothetical protein
VLGGREMMFLFRWYHELFGLGPRAQWRRVNKIRRKVAKARKSVETAKVAYSEAILRLSSQLNDIGHAEDAINKFPKG